MRKIKKLFLKFFREIMKRWYEKLKEITLKLCIICFSYSLINPSFFRFKLSIRCQEGFIKKIDRTKCGKQMGPQNIVKTTCSELLKERKDSAPLSTIAYISVGLLTIHSCCTSKKYGSFKDNFVQKNLSVFQVFWKWELRTDAVVYSGWKNSKGCFQYVLFKKKILLSQSLFEFNPSLLSLYFLIF